MPADGTSAELEVPSLETFYTSQYVQQSLSRCPRCTRRQHSAQSSKGTEQCCLSLQLPPGRIRIASSGREQCLGYGGRGRGGCQTTSDSVSSPGAGRQRTMHCGVRPQVKTLVKKRLHSACSLRGRHSQPVRFTSASAPHSWEFYIPITLE